MAVYFLCFGACFMTLFSFVSPEGFEPPTYRLKIGSSGLTELRARVLLFWARTFRLHRESPFPFVELCGVEPPSVKTRRLQRQSPSEDEPQLRSIWIGAAIAFTVGVHLRLHSR